VPTNLAAARPFFQAQGWEFSESCYDLAQSMQEYQAPADPAIDVAIELATPADAPERWSSSAQSSRIGWARFNRM
jgi:hypothetical protein